MRCFIALDLDDAIKSQLTTAQGWFGALKGKVSWTKREQMHLTIKFLGEVPDDMLAQVVDVLSNACLQVQPFEFDVAGLGCFPSSGRQLRIVWAGITAPTEMAKLNDLLQQGYVELGYEAEKRKFTPHLTIGRVRYVANAQAYRAVIGEHGDFIAGRQACDHVTLYRSDLEPTGAVYTAIETIPMTGT